MNKEPHLAQVRPKAASFFACGIEFKGGTGGHVPPTFAQGET